MITKNSIHGLVSLVFWVLVTVGTSFLSPILALLEQNKWNVLPWFVAVLFFGLEFYLTMRITTLYRYGDECLNVRKNEILTREADEKEQIKYEEISEISRKLSSFFKGRSITWSYCALASFWSLILVFIAFLLALFDSYYWVFFFMGSIVFLSLCLTVHAFRIGFRREDWLMSQLAIFPFLKVEFPDEEELIDTVCSGKWV